MKKVQEIVKEHSDWLGKFGMGLILFSSITLLLGMLGMSGASSRTDYVPFHDLKAVQITNVIYSDDDSGTYVEGIADGNRKIHIDVAHGKIPSNFKNTKNAVVYETSDKELYLNQKDYDEENPNPKVSKHDSNNRLKSFIATMGIFSIVFSGVFATASTKNNKSAA